jgi:hypothetical protein
MHAVGSRAINAILGQRLAQDLVRKTAMVKRLLQGQNFAFGHGSHQCKPNNAAAAPAVKAVKIMPAPTVR